MDPVARPTFNFAPFFMEHASAVDVPGWYSVRTLVVPFDCVIFASLNDFGEKRLVISETMRPKMRLLPEIRPRASVFGKYPTSSATFQTRLASWGSTLGKSSRNSGDGDSSSYRELPGRLGATQQPSLPLPHLIRAAPGHEPAKEQLAQREVPRFSCCVVPVRSGWQGYWRKIVLPSRPRQAAGTQGLARPAPNDGETDSGSAALPLWHG